MERPEWRRLASHRMGRVSSERAVWGRPGQLGVRSLGTAPPATAQPAWGQGPSGEAAREQAEGWDSLLGLGAQLWPGPELGAAGAPPGPAAGAVASLLGLPARHT